MIVYFFHFEKKLNSTKRPDLNTMSYKEYTVNWKRPTSLTSPTIEVSVESISEWDLDYNYIYIPSFKRFYFIQNLTVVSANIIEYSLSVDVLASYKNDILNSDLYVLRSSSNYSDLIPDEAIVHNSEVHHAYMPTSIQGFDPQGCYILTLINGDNEETANPSNTMYVVSGSELSAFVSYIYDEARIQNFEDPDLIATFYNPLQYVSSCRWFPLNKEDIQGAETSIKYGWYDTNINAHYVTEYGRTLRGSITVPLSGNVWYALNNDWVNHSLYIRGFGSCDIDPIYSGKNLNIEIYIDYNTGNSRCLILDGTSASSNSIISELHGKLSAEISLSQLQANPNLPLSPGSIMKTGLSIFSGSRGLGASIVGFFKDLGSGKGFTNSITQNFGKSTASSIGESTKQNILNPSIHTIGANGDIYFIQSGIGEVLIHTRYFLPESFPTLECGKPLNKVVLLATLSGYTQVANGLIKIGGLVEERNAITTILEGGFFIE